MPVESMEWTADRTSVGRYDLSQEAVADISNFKTFHLSSDSQYKGNVQVYGNMLYEGNPQKPEVRFYLVFVAMDS